MKKGNKNFPTEWACCTALPVCVEFRWERKRVYLLASAFLTTINLGVRAINIMFPPIHVSLAGKCSWQTESKAEFAVTVVGRARGALSEGQITFCDLKKNTLRTCRTKSNTKIHRIIFLADLNLFLPFDIDLLQIRVWHRPQGSVIFYLEWFQSNFFLEYDEQIWYLRQALVKAEDNQRHLRWCNFIFLH